MITRVPSTIRRWRTALGLALIAALALPWLASRPISGAAPGVLPALPQRAPDAPEAQPGAITYWGLNVYLTKNERIVNGDNLTVLATSARAAGAQWTLEEFPWAEIEPNDNDWRTSYDSRIKQVADNNLGIIGMLLTSPRWARDPGCPDAFNNFWCPPADVHQYAEFAGWMAERYDGDGVADAPGSPRVAAWQIWNEPNDQALWPRLNGSEAARRQRYGLMAFYAYSAIKAADPTATVILGGVYLFDGSNSDGFDFLNGANGAFQQVPAAKQSFDVFGIHPYMPDIRPDQVGTFSNIVLEGRLTNARKWLNVDIGRPDARIWITEIGWCTTGPAACPGVGEVQQARNLIRAMVIAQQMGIQHTNWLQLEDAFEGNHPFAGSAIVNNLSGGTYPPKLAYAAYQTLATIVGSAAPAGTGPLHSHSYTPGVANTGGTYNYRYVRGSTVIDVLWLPTGSVSAQYPLFPNKQRIFYTRAGQTYEPSISGDTATLTISEDPIFVVQRDLPSMVVKSDPVRMLAEDAATSARGGFTIANGASEGSFAWSASNVTAGYTVSPGNGTATQAQSNVLVTADISARGPGTYSGQFTLSGSGVAAQTIDIQVVVAAALRRTYVPLLTR